MNWFSNLINIEVKNNMSIVGLTDEFFCVYLINLLRKEKRGILVVVNSLYDANKLFSSLQNYCNDVLLFPMDDFLTSEAIAISPDLQMERLECINSIILNDKKIVITNLTGYLRFLPSTKTYNHFIFDIVVGDKINQKELVDKLIKSGYIRDSLVTKTGEIAVRGYIFDIYPVGEEYPVRIEFFDDEIDSIRYFDADNQKSLKNINNITIKPYWEFLSENNIDPCYFGKQKYLKNYEKVVSILNYIKDPILIQKDYDQLKNSYFQIENEMFEYKSTRDMNFSGNYMFSLDDIDVCNSILINYLSINNIISCKNNITNFNVKTVSSFNENVDSINNFINKSINVGKTIIICVNDYQKNSLFKFLNMKLFKVVNDEIIEKAVNIIDGSINNGFIYDNYVVISAKELFNLKNNNKKYNNKFKYASSIKDISKLSIGDYVVHNVHGIGIYNGIKTLTLNNISKDYLEVFYQGKDKLYIPVEKIDLLYKYSGKEGMIPKINKLGGTEWEKTKARVRKKVTDMADRLLKLYAERESKKGFSFSNDCDMMIDFENQFPYELTDDQKKAIIQIKNDMESSIPMDRLLCGDVGFGKTEVAFVAAFKAILDSKQVLLLCPTTILSNQHYENAKERFKGFPVSIALLNRFTSVKETKKIIEGIKNGKVDMIIGTHRLLSNDIVPHDLGLLIIDEEQRFGVAHKEKIKQYKTNVDVLTLTATPIPRTLQMSMVGIRSLSLIETPPVNRYPIQTYVIEENNQILKDAIYKELSRNGQTFILYNKVESIDEETYRISNLVPDAKIVNAHGQMQKNELESRIIDFINHKYDVLVCTTIIETGIDIPNVNTLIIMDADRFGLSQLYQIRGRVGRSDKFAYAYLFYQKSKVLTENAIKRLNVIKEFTELGSGFSIATRDLSIRGAGDILGSEQAGFIDSIGIDLYLKMLNEEVMKRKNVDFVSDAIDCDKQPLLNVNTHIDDNYVKEDELKILIHRKINDIDSKEKFEIIKSELEDRFGKLDDNMIIYMYEEWFEKLAEKLGINHVNQRKNFIELVFPEKIVEKIDTEIVFMDAFYISNMFRFISRGKNLVIVLDTIKLDMHPVFYLVELLNTICKKIF